MSNVLQQINDDMANISDKVLDSLVQIHNGQRGIGAGAIWHRDGIDEELNDTIIVTNAHVLLGRRGQVSNNLSVTLRDGRHLPTRLLAYDVELDLAALHISAPDLTPLEIGDSRMLNAGDLVLALGFPWGIKGGATSGVVIGTGAHLPELGDSKREWIAASLHLRPGHSGGPMVDSRGRLVGINTLMNGPEVGVAIPVHVAKEFLNEALANKRPASPEPDREAIVIL
jgi:serine protease Do